jgi:hypothetical protein
VQYASGSPGGHTTGSRGLQQGGMSGSPQRAGGASAGRQVQTGDRAAGGSPRVNGASRAALAARFRDDRAAIVLLDRE